MRGLWAALAKSRQADSVPTSHHETGRGGPDQMAAALPPTERSVLAGRRLQGEPQVHCQAAKPGGKPPSVPHALTNGQAGRGDAPARVHAPSGCPDQWHPRGCPQPPVVLPASQQQLAVPAGAPQAPDVRAGSLPQPLAGLGGQQQTAAGSGPGAPVSPDPSASAALCRVSSNPCPAGFSDSSLASTHSCSTGDDGTSKEGSGRNGQLSRLNSVTEGTQAAAAPPAAAKPTAAAAASSGAAPPPAAASAQWRHPVLGPPAAQPAQGWTVPFCLQPGGATPPAALPSASPPPVGDGGSPLSPQLGDTPPHGSSAGNVSLLTTQLRGASAASSAAASREASLRSGIKRQPGGLTLALSRENSLRGGATRESSVRDGSQRSASRRDSSQRSVSLRSGGGRQEGSVLAQWGVSPFAGAARRSQHELLADPAAAAAGRGSGDWLGLLTVTEGLTPADALARALMDPFAAPSCAAPAVPALALHDDDDDEDAFVPTFVLPPQVVAAPPHAQVGSWAERVTNFDPKPAASQAALPKHGGGPIDALLLTAALEALAGPRGSSAGGSGPRCDVLVGDSELALAGSGELAPQQHRSSTAWQLARSGNLGAESAPGGTLLCGSWGGGGIVPALPPSAPLGGSAPTRGLSLHHGSHDSGGFVRRVGSQPLGCDVTAATQEWNRDFMKRWRAVKKRAYRQALGLRALWRVNSLSDRHEPLELLTNDLPQHDNGMRRAYSASRLTPSKRGARGGVDAAALHKDPSLATMLLGELAEVC